MVEGDALPLARRLGRALGGRVVAHPRFGTAAVELPHGAQLDLVTARRESYARPGRAPRRHPGNPRRRPRAPRLHDQRGRPAALGRRAPAPWSTRTAGSPTREAGIVRALRADAFARGPQPPGAGRPLRRPPGLPASTARRPPPPARPPRRSTRRAPASPTSCGASAEEPTAGERAGPARQPRGPVAGRPARRGPARALRGHRRRPGPARRARPPGVAAAPRARRSTPRPSPGRRCRGGPARSAPRGGPGPALAGAPRAGRAAPSEVDRLLRAAPPATAVGALAARRRGGRGVVGGRPRSRAVRARRRPGGGRRPARARRSGGPWRRCAPRCSTAASAGRGEQLALALRLAREEGP